MIDDMTVLAAAVSVIGGPIVFVTSLQRAVTMNLWSYREPPYAIFGSPALAANDVMAVAARGLASAVAASPEIDTSKLATVHMEDATAQPIIGGSPASPTPAAPTRSIGRPTQSGSKSVFPWIWACVISARSRG